MSLLRKHVKFRMIYILVLAGLWVNGVGRASEGASSVVERDKLVQADSMPVPPKSTNISSPSNLTSPPLENTDALPETSGAMGSTPWESNLWSRIVSEFAIPDLEGSVVERHERSYSDNPDRLKKIIERSKPYLYYIVNEVERRGMPMEVALLPMIESAFNPYAYSHAHASGLWQIMPSTGRHLGLSQNRELDERMDVMAATRSALDYLEYLHTLFPDWQLALAAYNWGEGSLGRSIARNQNRGLLVDYWSISMPKETRNYVPKLQALKNIIRNPAEYGVEIPVIPDRPYFRSVMVDRPMVVRHVAQLADISVNEFSSLNPAFKKSVINGGGNQYRLLIPVEKASVLEQGILGVEGRPLAKVDELFNPSAWAVSQVNNGDKQEGASSKAALASSAVMPSQGLKGEVRVGAGETLALPVVSDQIVKPELKTMDDEDNSEEVDQPEATVVHWKSYRVSRRDTLQKIAQRYGVSVEDIQRWNRLHGGRLQTGHMLRLRVEHSIAARKRIKVRAAKEGVVYKASTSHARKEHPRYRAISKRKLVLKRKKH